MATMQLKQSNPTAVTSNNKESFQVSEGANWELIVEEYIVKKTGEKNVICKHVGDAVYFKGLSARSMAVLITSYNGDMAQIQALVDSVFFCKEINDQLKKMEVTTLEGARALFK